MEIHRRNCMGPSRPPFMVTQLSDLTPIDRVFMTCSYTTFHNDYDAHARGYQLHCLLSPSASSFSQFLRYTITHKAASLLTDQCTTAYIILAVWWIMDCPAVDGVFLTMLISSVAERLFSPAAKVLTARCRPTGWWDKLKNSCLSNLCLKEN